MSGLAAIASLFPNEDGSPNALQRFDAALNPESQYKQLQQLLMEYQIAQIGKELGQDAALKNAMMGFGPSASAPQQGGQTPASAPLPNAPSALASMTQPRPTNAPAQQQAPVNPVEAGRVQQQEILKRVAGATNTPEAWSAYAKTLAPTADERKQQLAEESEAGRMRENVNRVEDFVIPGIDEAIDFAKNNYISVNKTFGGYGQMIRGSKAYQLKEKLQPVKSALSLDKLQQMKDNSPTGASGLGPLAVKELESLEKSVASLELGQETRELIKNANKVKRHYQNWVNIMKKAKPSDFAGGVKPDLSSMAPSPSITSREDWLKKSPMMRSQNAQ